MSSIRHHSIIFEPVAVDAPWQAYRCQLAFPLSPEDRERVTSFIDVLTQAVGRLNRLHPSLWLDSAEIHRDGGSRLLSSHIREWSPEVGFAFDPSGPAPRTLEFSDLTEATYGTPPKIFDRSALFISSLKATQSAYSLLVGRGVATILFFREDASSGTGIKEAVKRFKENSRRTLEPMMASAMFRHHRFYLPLLSSNSIAKATLQQLEDWLGGTELLWRENYEDGELLLLSVRDLAPAFEAAGLSRLSVGEGPAPWSFTPQDEDGKSL